MYFLMRLSQGSNVIYVDKYGREYIPMDPKTVPGAQIAEAIPSAPPVTGEVRPAISRSSNPFEAEIEILSHQMRTTRIYEQSTQPPRESANQPTLRAWL